MSETTVPKPGSWDMARDAQQDHTALDAFTGVVGVTPLLCVAAAWIKRAHLAETSLAEAKAAFIAHQRRQPDLQQRINALESEVRRLSADPLGDGSPA